MESTFALRATFRPFWVPKTQNFLNYGSDDWNIHSKSGKAKQSCTDYSWKKQSKQSKSKSGFDLCHIHTGCLQQKPQYNTINKPGFIHTWLSQERASHCHPVYRDKRVTNTTKACWVNCQRRFLGGAVYKIAIDNKHVVHLYVRTR